MEEVTLVLQVPSDLKEVILNIVEQICSITSSKYNTGEVYSFTSKKEETKKEEKEQKEENSCEEFPPSKESVTEYLRNRKSPIDPDRFYGWMVRNNWIDGRGEPIKDWKAKAKEWESREFQKRSSKPTQKPAAQPAKVEKQDDTKKLLERLTRLQEANE